MDHETGDFRVGHNPQPVELDAFFPGCFIEIINILASGYVSYSFIMRFDCCRGPINDLLYGSETNRNTEDGRTECFNCFTAVSVNTADLADQGCESWAETGLEFAGYVSFAGFTAGCTLTLIMRIRS
jgi:hypothetical protein